LDFDAGSTGAVTRIGPLALSAGASSPIAVHVKPVDLAVFEEVSAASGALQVLAASAHLTEVRPGSAVVSIQIAGLSTPMPFDATKSAYYVQFTTPPAAQPTYQITTAPTAGGTPTTWSLVAAAPTSPVAITSPLPGATVTAAQPLTVRWPLQLAADYVRVELFQGSPSAWRLVYASPQPDADDVGLDAGGAMAMGAGEPGETIPAANLMTPGMYLVNVVFAKANCPTTADGCVHSSTVANEQITVK